MTWLENLPTVFVGEKPLEQQCCYRIDKRLKTPDNVFDIFASNFWRGKVVTYSSTPVCPSKGSWHCSILYMAVTICAFLLYFFFFYLRSLAPFGCWMSWLNPPGTSAGRKSLLLHMALLMGLFPGPPVGLGMRAPVSHLVWLFCFLKL